MNNNEKAIKQALASMKLDGIIVSQECIERIAQKSKEKIKILTIKKDKSYEARL